MSDTEGQDDLPKERPTSPTVLETFYRGAGPSHSTLSARPSRSASPIESNLQHEKSSSDRNRSPDRAVGRPGRARSAEGRKPPKRNDVVKNEKEIRYIVRERDDDKAPKKNPFKASDQTKVISAKDTSGQELLRQMLQERMTDGAVIDDDFMDDTLARGIEVSDGHIVKPARMFGQLDMNEDQVTHLRNFKKDSRNMVTAEFSLKYVEKMCKDFKHQLSEQTILDHLYLVLPDKCLQDWQRLRDTPGMKLKQVYKELCTLYGNAKSQKYLRQELLSICADMDSEVRDVLNRIHINLSRTESSSIRERNLRCLEEVQIYLKRRIGPTSAALIFTRFEARKLANFSDLIDLIEADFPEVFARDKLRREKGRVDKHKAGRVHEILQDHPPSDDDSDDDVKVIHQVDEKLSAFQDAFQSTLVKTQEENAKCFSNLADTLANVNNVIQGRGPCHNCGQTGHFILNCPTNPKRAGGSKQNSIRKRRYCDQPCSVPGHTHHKNVNCTSQNHPCRFESHTNHSSNNCFRPGKWDYMPDKPALPDTKADPNMALQVEVQQLKALMAKLQGGQNGNQ